jgi:hypothetical protein
VASAQVPVENLTAGSLPEVCVKTGVPCTNFVRTPLRAYKSGSSLGRLFTMGRPVAARIPAVPQRVRLHTALVVLSWVVAVVLIVSLVVSIAADLSVAVPLVAFVAYLALVAGGSLVWIGAETTDDADAIVLTRVHPDFAQAVESQAPPAR